ncbi:unnamed protein product [Hermetia illucens]|uniref:HAT C-terminal dimerisation domain-containing protein n=1 Tax=Hermetia illucens TaxID=343691 RepID=A0A7R8UJ01_HERIL|nr:unnamed protein product [Hermetia illucens]
MKRFFEVVSKDPQRASSSSEPDSESTEGINESPEKDKECEKSKKQKYEQKYVKYWESEFKWLSEGTKGCHYAFCKVCSVDVYIGKMGKSAIKSHANTQIHTKNAGTISLNLVQQNIEPLFSSASKTAVIDAEIIMAVFVAEHNLAFQIMGHLPSLTKLPRIRILPKKNLSIIAPDNVYACTYKSIAPLLQQVPRLLADNIQEIDSEYRALINFVKDKEQILDIEEFWRMVARIEIGNEQAFPNLVKLVFAILSFPHSSANVERVFSQVNLMKTKIRNRLENATIKACLQTKGY